MQELRSLLENACSDSLQGPLMQVRHRAAYHAFSHITSSRSSTCHTCACMAPSGKFSIYVGLALAGVGQGKGRKTGWDSDAFGAQNPCSGVKDLVALHAINDCFGPQRAELMSTECGVQFAGSGF
jgi:hypothetical protein